MQRRILGLLFAVLFLVMIGFSILFPVEPYYIQMFGATSATMGWLMASFSLAQFVFSPLWGRLSDRIGRKPVMMIGLAGYGVSMALFALAQSIPHLFIARSLSGILSSATLPTAMAVISDTTSRGRASQRHGAPWSRIRAWGDLWPFRRGRPRRRNDPLALLCRRRPSPW